MRRTLALCVVLAAALAAAWKGRACGGPPDPGPDSGAGGDSDNSAGARRDHAAPVPRAAVASGEPADSVPTATVAATGAVALDVHGILRSADGTALAGARVGLLAFRGAPEDDRDEAIGEETHVVTGADGRFAFRGVPSSTVRVVVVADDHVTARFLGTVHGDGTPLELRVRRGGKMSVSVTDENGRPFAGATVGLFPMPRVTFAGHYKTWLRCDRTTTTAADGTCVVTGIDDRRFQIAATAEGRGLDAKELASGDAAVRLVLDGTNRGGHRWAFAGFGAEPREPGIPPDSREPPDPPPPASTSTEASTASEPGAPGAADPPAAPTTDEPEPAPPEPPAPPVTELVAIVLTADGVPVRGAWVNVRRVEDRDGDLPFSRGSAAAGREGYDRTEADGTARVEVEPGTWIADAGPDEFDGRDAKVQATFQAAAGESRRLELRLPGVFAVPVVVRAASGRPVRSASLEVRSGGDSFHTSTDADGKGRVLAVRGRPLHIEVRARGLPAASVGPVSVPPEQPVAIELLDRATIRGRVVDPSGAPLFGVEIGVRAAGAAPDAEFAWTAWTDERGEFAVPGPPAGEFDVSAIAPAFRETVTRGVRVPQSGDVVLRLAERATLRGIVADALGVPLAGAWIVCEDGRGGQTSSAPDGTFVLSHRLASDEAEQTIGCEGFVHQTVRATVGSPCEVRLERDRETK